MRENVYLCDESCMYPVSPVSSSINNSNKLRIDTEFVVKGHIAFVSIINDEGVTNR